jgi:hypothetical protein
MNNNNHQHTSDVSKTKDSTQSRSYMTRKGQALYRGIYSQHVLIIISMLKRQLSDYTI